jgi:hypothetical protein
MIKRPREEIKNINKKTKKANMGLSIRIRAGAIGATSSLNASESIQ